MNRGSIFGAASTLVTISRYLLMAGIVAVAGIGLFGIASPGRLSPVLGNTSMELRDLGLSISVPLSGIDPEAVRPLLGLMTGLGLVALTLALWIVENLRGILRTTSSGSPFVTKNAGRVRGIGLAVLCWAGLKILVQASAGTYLSNHLTWPGVDLNVKVDLAAETILFGLLVLVLAEVFRYGVALQEEHDLTV